MNKKKWGVNYFFVTFFYMGYFPFIPGSLASFFVMVSSLIPIFMKSKFNLCPLLFFVLSIIFFPFVGQVLKETENEDPPFVVVDEVMGQSLVLLFSPNDLRSYLIAFFLFRVFDILKPFPIRRAEKIKGTFGVYVDDLIAALFSVFVLRFIIMKWL